MCFNALSPVREIEPNISPACPLFHVKHHFEKELYPFL